MASYPRHRTWHTALFLLPILLNLPCVSHADAVYDLAPTRQNKIGQLGFQSKWQSHWLQTNERYLGGYWGTSITRNSLLPLQVAYSSGTPLQDVGVSAVLRFQRNDGTGFYAEAGAGPQYQVFSYDWTGRPQGSRLALNTSAGVGFVWKNGFDIGFKANYSTRGQGSDGGDAVGAIGMGIRYRW